MDAQWMLICQRCTEFQPAMEIQDDFDWTTSAQSYPDLDEAPSFITQQQQTVQQTAFTITADPSNLSGKQLQVYNAVCEHYEGVGQPPLRMTVSGTAGTGKTYLIHCLRLLLQHQVYVAAPTGVAAFNVEGHTPLTPQPPH